MDHLERPVWAEGEKNPCRLPGADVLPPARPHSLRLGSGSSVLSSLPVGRLGFLSLPRGTTMSCGKAGSCISVPSTAPPVRACASGGLHGPGRRPRRTIQAGTRRVHGQQLRCDRWHRPCAQGDLARAVFLKMAPSGTVSPGPGAPRRHWGGRRLARGAPPCVTPSLTPKLKATCPPCTCPQVTGPHWPSSVSRTPGSRFPG